MDTPDTPDTMDTISLMSALTEPQAPPPAHIKAPQEPAGVATPKRQQIVMKATAPKTLPPAPQPSILRSAPPTSEEIITAGLSSIGLSMILPSQAITDRFVRAVITAVQKNPNILHADRTSLFLACQQAAQDGLMPDGRDAALVVFGSGPTAKVQYMPMVYGIIRRLLQCGDLARVSAHVIYSGDQYEITLGDIESIVHRPNMLGDRGVPVCVYAIAWGKDGTIFRETMSVREVERVRGISRSKDGVTWTQWWDEMAEKSCIRRLAKRIPTTEDLSSLFDYGQDIVTEAVADQPSMISTSAQTPMENLRAKMGITNGVHEKEDQGGR